MADESRLLQFYRGGEDDCGRRLDDILAWDDPALEHTHDFIQWLFPLREPSRAHPAAPVLSAEDVRAFCGDAALQERMRAALAVMLRFYGIDPPGPQPWVAPGNHNFLRLTRMLRSLRTAGLAAEARRLGDALTAIYRRHPDTIGAPTFAFWRQAMTEADERLA